MKSSMLFHIFFNNLKYVPNDIPKRIDDNLELNLINKSYTKALKNK